MARGPWRQVKAAQPLPVLPVTSEASQPGEGWLLDTAWVAVGTCEKGAERAEGLKFWDPRSSGRLHLAVHPPRGVGGYG